MCSRYIGHLKKVIPKVVEVNLVDRLVINQFCRMSNYYNTIICVYVCGIPFMLSLLNVHLLYKGGFMICLYFCTV